MSRLRLLHITLWGPNVPLSTVEFGPGLTLVRGPSDTGKSFMVEALDFMLGGKSLKEIPERNGYSTVLLGVELPAGETVTLTRSVAGALSRSTARTSAADHSQSRMRIFRRSTTRIATRTSRCSC